MKIQVFYISIILVLSALLGYTTFLTIQRNARIEELATNQVMSSASAFEVLIRLGTVTALHPESSEISVTLLNPVTENQTIMRMRITQQTVVQIENPIIENGEVIGFTEATKTTLSDIRIGSRVRIRFTLSSAGTLTITNISIGNPFPRF